MAPVAIRRSISGPAPPRGSRASVRRHRSDPSAGPSGRNWLHGAGPTSSSRPLVAPAARPHRRTSISAQSGRRPVAVRRVSRNHDSTRFSILQRLRRLFCNAAHCSFVESSAFRTQPARFADDADPCDRDASRYEDLRLPLHQQRAVVAFTATKARDSAGGPRRPRRCRLRPGRSRPARARSRACPWPP